jgi:hypothetical protein
MQVSVQPGGLAPGKYTAVLTVTAAGAMNSPATLFIQLHVSAPSKRPSKPETLDVHPVVAMGQNQIVTATFSDENGWSDLTSVTMRINSFPELSGSCTIDYSPATQLIRLINDSGTGWIGPKRIGDSGTLVNAQCVLRVADTMAHTSHTSLQIAYALSFKPAFSKQPLKGRKTVCLTATDASGLTSDWSCIGTLYPAQVMGEPTARYRIYMPQIFNHLFTIDPHEYSVLKGYGYIPEGLTERIYDAPIRISGIEAVPLYRVYMLQSQRHFWTADRNEYLTLIRQPDTYLGEGADGFVFPVHVSGTVAQYRVLHPVASPPIHHWTIDKNEYITLVQAGWIDEGVAGWVLPSR